MRLVARGGVDPNVPYMTSTKNLHKILDAMQGAETPPVFGLDFLVDLGFTSSNDRSILKVLRYLGMIDTSGKPQTSYREIADHTKARAVLAARLKAAYDDLYTSYKQAHERTTESLKGWFKTKTGAGAAVASKMATTFKALASYADFTKAGSEVPVPPPLSPPSPGEEEARRVKRDATGPGLGEAFGLVYRIEIHLPDTQNVETFRAIFRAIREELT